MDDLRTLLPLLSPQGPRSDVRDRHPQQKKRLQLASSEPVGPHLAAVLQRYQVLLVSASLKPSTLAQAASWTATDPINLVTLAPPGTPDMTKPPKLQLLPDTISHQARRRCWHLLGACARQVGAAHVLV